jgi:hypothetical protein
MRHLREEGIAKEIYMQQLDDNIWVFDGGSVPFFTIPYSTRMVVVRLSDHSLWVHSPIRLTDQVRADLEALGEVKFLIAPNHLHHLFIGAWQQAYPNAQTFGTSEVVKKRLDLTFDGFLTTDSQFPWSSDITQRLVTGSKVMEECVFFHNASQTLVVTDLVENFRPEYFKPWQRWIAQGVGILAPNGKMPLDWRLTFMFSKPEIREHLSSVLAWQPKRLVMAHGEMIESEAQTFLRRSFSWLRNL